MKAAYATRHKPNLIMVGEGAYVLDAEEVGSQFHVEQVHRDRNGEVRCTLTVKCVLEGVQALDDFTLQIFDNFNLSDARAKLTAAETLRHLAKTGNHVDWRSQLEDVALRVRRAEQTGTGSVVLAQTPRSPAAEVFLADGFPLPKHQPTVVAGPGDAGKSFFALHLAGTLQQQGVPVLFLDYEMDAGEHRNRLEALFGLDMPGCRFLRMTRPIRFEIDRLTREIYDHQIRYLIIDSQGPACGGSLKEEDSALGYNQALRTLRVGSLTLAHVPKARPDDKKDSESIFGSVYFYNLARSVWMLRIAPDSPEGVVVFGAFHIKHNLGPKSKPLGFELRFAGERVSVHRVDLADIPSMTEKLSIYHRLIYLLKKGPRPLYELTAELDDCKSDSVEKAIRRQLGKTFVKIQSADGVEKVSLLERRYGS